MILSTYQQDVKLWTEANTGTGNHLIVNAVAGSGKTTTAIEIMKSVRNVSAVYVAFNRDIRQAVAGKLPSGVQSHTYHSLGRAAIANAFGGVQLNEEKVTQFVQQDPKMKYLAFKVKKLVSIAKGNGNAMPDDEWLNVASIEYDVDFEDTNGRENQMQKNLVFDWVRKAISYSIDNPTVIDYDDMIFLPYIMPEHIAVPQYDLFIVDEVQDTNLVQMHLAIRGVKPNGNIIGIGDRMQAIYAFRGAGSESMDDFKQMLGASELPLSLCYRCPKEVAKYVNNQFRHIKFEVPETAIDGFVSDIQEDKSIESMKEGDLVLCRVNADLVRTAFDLIRAGKKATIKGKDFGKGLSAIIRKSNAGTTKEFLNWLDGWMEREINKANRINSESKRQNAIDKYDSLQIIAEGTNDVGEIAVRCNNLFDDKRRGITLSTVHKSKGLEVDTNENDVYILRPDLMPHPAAHGSVQLQQEDNIRYVAYTRTKRGLYFVR